MDNAVKSGNSVGMNLQLEQTTIKARADIKVCDPEQQQIDDDNAQIPNVGDQRILKRQGTISAPDGETFIKTDLTFIRKRNAHGGVDVTCIVPSLATTAEKG